ncbi:MAG: AAA family ATPase, partial [bacterium]
NNTNKNNSQLIITTHDTTLLTNKFFRRDQIWFVEKVNSETKVYSLSDFSSKIVRKDTPFDKWYLSGKFGALPLIQDIDLIDWE